MPLPAATDPGSRSTTSAVKLQQATALWRVQPGIRRQIGDYKISHLRRRPDDGFGLLGLKLHEPLGRLRAEQRFDAAGETDQPLPQRHSADVTGGLGAEEVSQTANGHQRD